MVNIFVYLIKDQQKKQKITVTLQQPFKYRQVLMKPHLFVSTIEAHKTCTMRQQGSENNICTFQP